MLFCRWRVGFDLDFEFLEWEEGIYMVCYVCGKECIMFINKIIDIVYIFNFIRI